MAPPDRFNLAENLVETARRAPNRDAVVWKARAGGYHEVTFGALDRMTSALASALRERGFEPGQRVLLMVPPGMPFLSSSFALLKAGCTPVVIDPGMDEHALAAALAVSRPSGLFGTGRLYAMRERMPRAFSSIERDFRWPDDDEQLGPRELHGECRHAMAATRGDDPAFLLFTTGSTGTPKPVVWTHVNFDAARRTVRDARNIEPGEVDMPTFALFSVFNLGNGVTSAIPEVEPGKPGECDPAKLVELIEARGVTTTFGAPALWQRLTSYCRERAIKLPSLRRVVVAGGSVAPQLLDAFQPVLVPPADVYMGYGATEIFGITSISGREVLQSQRTRDVGAGLCLGRPMPRIDVRVIRIDDAPIAAWHDDLVLPPGAVGEIVVRGEMVTRSYFERPDANALAKIPDGDQTWHRMGDLGYFDAEGRLWFCGRKSQRVQLPSGNVFTEPCEAVFCQHPRVARAALVGVVQGGCTRAAIVAQPRADDLPLDDERRAALRDELFALARRHAHTREISWIGFHEALPLDVRHNSKILREKVAAWAQEQIDGQPHTAIG
jgi:acyl-CoA synthetase (AMP-forming)/AMP-acid ligase II